MQSFFQSELAKLKKRIIKMFGIAGMQLDKASRSIGDRDYENHDSALKDENRLDKLDIKIDKLCQRIFALAQPVATDLRFIMSSLRIGNEIERIGDIALDIISRSESVRSYDKILAKYQVPDLIAEVIRLTKQCEEAYTNSNSELAKDIIFSCKQTQESCKTTFNKIIADMTRKSDVITIATDLILIIRDMERMADHFENVADSVVFIAEGKRVRHSDNPLPNQ